MSLTVIHDSYRSYKRYKLDSYANKSTEHLSCKRMDSSTQVQGTGATKSKEKSNHRVPNLQEKNVNTSMSTTAVKNYSGRLSFGAANNAAAKVGEEVAEIGGPVMQAIAKNRVVKKLIQMADEQFLVFEAVCALAINCVLRPLTIMALPADAKDKEKNKKTASKAIASGVMGYLCALALTVPLTAAMKRVKANPAKYMSKDAIKFYTGKENAKNLNDVAKVKTTEDVIKKVFEVGMIPVRAGLTVALLPIIDKNIISKLYGSESDKKVDYLTNRLYLKGAEMPSDAFKKFREGKA